MGNRLRTGKGLVVLCCATLLGGGLWLGTAPWSSSQTSVGSLRLTANTTRVALGGILRVDLTTENPPAGARADLYAGVLVPGGGLVFRRADGTFSLTPASLARGAAVVAGTIRILDLPLPANLAAGTYTFLAAYVRASAEPAQANLASNLAALDVVIGPPTVSFQRQIRPIFSASCALSGCHSAGSLAGGLNLETDPYREIVDRTAFESFQGRSLPRIDPGRPENSYLVQKLLGAPGIEGAPMPQGRPPLPPTLIEAIRTWVTEGAPNS